VMNIIAQTHLCALKYHVCVFPEDRVLEGKFMGE